MSLNTLVETARKRYNRIAPLYDNDGGVGRTPLFPRLAAIASVAGEAYLVRAAAV